MSGRMRWALVIGASFLLVGPASVAPSAAQTTVPPADGNVVTIIVPIDITIKGADVVTVADRKRFADLAKMAQDFWWNPGLREHKYRDCFTIQIKIDLEVHPDVGRTFRDPTPHQIDWYDDPNIAVFVEDPAESDHTNDSPGAYTDLLTGQWGALDIGELVHELGHLLGLGDDYIRVPDDSAQGWHAEDKPGREGTVMGKGIYGRWGRRGNSIDQNVVDRLGDVMSAAEIKLPECWSLTIVSDTIREYLNPEYNEPGKYQIAPGSCSDSWVAEFSFTLSPEGAFTADGTATATAVAQCSFPMTAPPLSSRGLTISGTATPYAFEFQVVQTSSPEGQGDYAAYLALLLQDGWSPRMIVVPRTGGEPIRAEHTYANHGVDPVDLFTSINTIELRRETDR